MRVIYGGHGTRRVHGFFPVSGGRKGKAVMMVTIKVIFVVVSEGRRGTNVEGSVKKKHSYRA